MSLLANLGAPSKVGQIIKSGLILRNQCRILGVRRVSQDISKKSDEQLDPSTVDEGQPDQLYRYLWIKCSGHEVEVLDSYEQFLKLSAQHLDIDYVKTETPFRLIKRKTLLASRHVHKKYRVQYETRSYYRDLLFKNLTGSTMDTFLEYVERNIPEGVLFIAEKHKLGELPFELEKNQDK